MMNSSVDVMPKSWWSIEKFGNLRLKEPIDLSHRSGKKLAFVCGCGKEIIAVVRDVTESKKTSCGKCNQMPPFWWNNQKFGKLVIKTSSPIYRDSFSEETWTCECGQTTTARVRDVTSGGIKSCGNCDKVPLAWWDKKKRSKVQFTKIKKEIHDLVKSLGFDIKMDHKICDFNYDMVVSGSKTIIDCFNLKHDKKKINEKKRIAELFGYKYINIEETSWKKNREKISNSIYRELEINENISHSHKTKNEIISKIEELDLIIDESIPKGLKTKLNSRRNKLLNDLQYSYEDVVSAAISSHHVMCETKNMKPNDAFGNDPFVYYALGLVGEAGELTGALLRAIRNKGDFEAKKTAVESELADCMIYAIVLAYSVGIDLVKIVNDKARIVESRAKSGYYGAPQ